MKKLKLPKLLYLLLLTGLIAARPPTAQAQTSITAAPDGTGTIINYNGNTYHINGGTQAGANLFHSFQEFGLNPQEIANFLSNPNILNVVGRVTGGNPSIIQGLIQLTGGNSNLFLMNPSGWVFTQGASLDVPGSFGATTATRIGFGNNYFNAYGDNNYSTLIGSPTSLIFDQNNPSWIVNEADLAVPTGESLWMVGGGIISTGTVATENGNITLAAIPGKSQV
ncbi:MULTISPECIES: filamentous hemagglutinin N-terminal domain-containing protein, partial [Spirulina sp. CCY15215]|uniref:two-partner secretion domain-containing protein n=2 Tax=Spirulina sp. CCY15215 TaxID=2767591 RepID=UPI001950384F